MMQTCHFDKVVSDEGVVVLSGLPPLAKVEIVVTYPDPFDWKKELDALREEMKDHPFAKMSKEEILTKLRQTREEVYEEVYGHRHAD
jgi:anaerobic glycerol-3-phosphate dehydrogenase